jgi:hypothetical protein
MQENNDTHAFNLDKQQWECPACCDAPSALTARSVFAAGVAHKNLFNPKVVVLVLCVTFRILILVTCFGTAPRSCIIRALRSKVHTICTKCIACTVCL